MKIAAADFPLIRWSVIAFCTAALASAAMMYISGRYAQQTQNFLRDAQTHHQDARNRLNAAHEDQENMAEYADEYGKLMVRKVVGDEPRLDWIEALEKLRKQKLVLDFRYSIMPQKNYVSQPAVSSSNFDIHYSEMKLSFDLLHEEQLLNFFNALRLQSAGWYQLDGCTLKRNDNPSPATQVHLSAECTGGWITLKNRNAKS